MRSCAAASVAIAAPTTPLAASERARIRALVALYRLTGPIGPLANAVADALLAPEILRVWTRRPVTSRVPRSFRRTGVGMHRCTSSMMLRRPDITDLLVHVTAPALLLADSEDRMWDPAAASLSAQELSDGTSAPIDGAGHLPPLERPEQVVRQVLGLWARRP
ncbi:MAG: alpha/beta fold hydrolase [Jiangellaceae bacterium]